MTANVESDPLAQPHRSAQLDLMVDLTQQSLVMVRSLPAMPDRPALLASLDLLGRVARIAEHEILGLHGQEGPLGRLLVQNPVELRDLMNTLGHQDLAVRLDLLGLLVQDAQLSLQALRALVLLTQRDLLELDPQEG